MACILVMIGLPGSGKTTVSHKICDQLACCYRLVHIEYDAVVNLADQALWREARLADETDDRWRLVRRKLVSAVDSVLSGQPPDPKILRLPSRWQESEKPRVFVIDDNMYLRSMRYQYFQIARRHSVGFAEIYLDVTSETCSLRNADRCHAVPQEVVDRMCARLEPPDSSMFWEANSLHISDQSDRSVTLVRDLIDRALTSPAPPLLDNTQEVEEARRVCSTNQIHRLDQELRRLVGQYIGGRGERALLANGMRQMILKQVRSGDLGLGVEPVEGDVFSMAVQRLFDNEIKAAEEKGRDTTL